MFDFNISDSTFRRNSVIKIRHVQESNDNLEYQLERFLSNMFIYLLHRVGFFSSVKNAYLFFYV